MTTYHYSQKPEHTPQSSVRKKKNFVVHPQQDRDIVPLQSHEGSDIARPGIESAHYLSYNDHLRI